MSKIGFAHREGNNEFFVRFSLVFAYQQAKEQIWFQVQCLKMLNTIFLAMFFFKSLHPILPYNIKPCKQKI